MTLKKVRMELARCPEHPNGSSDYGYEIVAPLSADGHLDREAWERVKADCTVRRFWAQEDDENGRLVHTDSGWCFDYDPDRDDDDEPLFRLDDHLFAVGEYVSVTEHDGVQRTFEIVALH